MWSIHPKYLDTKGLVALWAEGLLAKKVLEGKTKGYRNHPQLVRFKNSENPIAYINAYLYEVYLEALRRGYSFNVNKLRPVRIEKRLSVTRGQLNYEFQLLLWKLRSRDSKKYMEIMYVKTVEAHPIFHVVDGGVEPWERVKGLAAGGQNLERGP